MKKIISFLTFIMITAVAMSQSVVAIRGDSIRIYKQGGNAELILENATKGRTGAFLQNRANGRLQFAFAVDSAWLNATGDSMIYRRGSTTFRVPVGGSAITGLPFANITGDPTTNSALMGQFNLKQNKLPVGTVSQYWDATGALRTFATDVRNSITATGPTAFNQSTGVISISQANGSTNGFLTSTDWNTFNQKLSSSRIINTTNSLVGGGSLTSDLTLSLQNDIAAPGASKYYGTNTSGLKGWWDLSAGGGADQNNYVTGMTFNPGTGVLTSTRQGLADITVGFDGRYLKITDTTGMANVPELDPYYNGSIASTITGTDTSHWSTAWRWGNHATAGYLKTELDPNFTGSPAAGITSGNITSWNAAVQGGANLGTGTGIFSAKVGTNLQFKTLIGGTGVTLSNTANDVTISTATQTLNTVTTNGSTTNNAITTGALTWSNGASVNVGTLGWHNSGANWGGLLTLKSLNGAQTATIKAFTLGANRNYILPDADGTIALTSDIVAPPTPPLASVLAAGNSATGPITLQSGANYFQYRWDMINGINGSNQVVIDPGTINITNGTTAINVRNDHVKFVGNGNTDAARLYAILPATGSNSLYLPNKGGRTDTLATMADVRTATPAGFVTGTATAGQLPYFSGPSAIAGSANATLDATGLMSVQKALIGTSTDNGTTEKLQIAGYMSATGGSFNSGSSGTPSAQFIKYQLNAAGENGSDNGFSLMNASGTASTRPVILGQRSRGTLNAPLATVADDWIFGIVAGAFDANNARQTPAAIEFKVDGTPGAGTVPARIEFLTGTAGGNRTPRFVVTSAGAVQFPTLTGTGQRLFTVDASGNAGVIANTTNGYVMTLVGGVPTWTTPAVSGANASGSYIVQTATNAPANAQILGSLGTGIVKNTTTTGVLSIATASDFPTLNQNTTGSAGSISGTNVVTNTNLSQMAAGTIKGNNTGATANAADLTSAQVATMIGAVQTTGTQTIGGLKTFSNTVTLNNVALQFQNGANTLVLQQPAGGVTAARSINFPDASGTIALTTDIPSTSGFVTLSGAQTITGLKTTTVAGGTLAANSNWAGTVFSGTTATEAATGIHQIVSAVRIDSVNLAPGAGATSANANLYIGMPSQVSTANNNYSLYVGGPTMITGKTYLQTVNAGSASNEILSFNGTSGEVQKSNPGLVVQYGLPTQTGNGGKVLTTDGSTLSWTTATGGGSGSPFYLENIIKAGFDTMAYFKTDGVAWKALKVAAGSTKLTVDRATGTTDSTQAYTIDIAPANITLSSLGGSLNTSQINATGGATGKVLSYDGTWVSNAGSTTFAGLSDVAITTPTSNQVPLYNATTSKWTNANSAIMNPSGLANNDFLRYNSATSEWINMTPTAATALLNVATTTLKGLVPAPGTATGKVLSDAMTWVAQSGGTTYTFNSSSIVNTSGNLALSGDAATPGNTYVYGTNATGTKGWQAGTAVDMTGMVSNDLIKWDGTKFVRMDGSSLVTTSGVQTLSQKTFSGVTNMAGLNLTGGVFNVTETGSTTTPAAGNINLYAHTSDRFRTINSTGTVQDVAYLTDNVAGSLLNVRYITTGTSYTPTTGTTKVLIEMVGGGGGGGGVTGAASSGAAGGGGGAGGYLVKYITGLTGAPFTIAIGAAGTAGANTGGTGGTGGNTTITIGATTYTAAGGAGGVGMTSGTAVAISGGGAAGSATNGDINTAGDPGLTGVRLSATVVSSGNGGSTRYGGGGKGTINATAAGVAGTGYGAGGSGATAASNVSNAGGAGTGGIIIVYEYK